MDLPEILIGDLLRKKNWKLAAAESCTGGLISHRITNIPGSSDYYLGGVCAYAYEAKESLLGVHHDTITTYGAVSSETVVEMALGVRHVLTADVSISASGIAGPGGGLPHKPVGTVWFGLAGPDGTWAKVFVFPGDRIQVKEASAEEIFQALLRYLQGSEPWENSRIA
mgnify:FL=1